MNKANQQKGFTIIEVVLVLAIAALIFLMVFIALPALQRNQRDTARKSDVGVVASAVTNYTSNTRSPLDNGVSDSDFQQYIDKLSQYDKANVQIVDNVPNENNPEERLDFIYVVPGSECEENKVVDGASRSVAIVAALENNGSSYLSYCQTA